MPWSWELYRSGCILWKSSLRLGSEQGWSPQVPLELSDAALPCTSQQHSTTTRTIAMTALNPAGHFFPPLLAIFPSKLCSIFSVSWVEALLEAHPCCSSVLFLLCSAAACPEPTWQLLVWVRAPAKHIHTQPSAEIISVPHFRKKTQQREPHPSMSLSWRDARR